MTGTQIAGAVLFAAGAAVAVFGVRQLRKLRGETRADPRADAPRRTVRGVLESAWMPWVLLAAIVPVVVSLARQVFAVAGVEGAGGAGPGLGARVLSDFTGDVTRWLRAQPEGSGR